MAFGKDLQAFVPPTTAANHHVVARELYFGLGVTPGALKPVKVCYEKSV
jgi:hypothetical protein